MTAADPSAILARAGLWAAELRERGQLDDAAAARLNETLGESSGERLDRRDDPLLVVMLCGPTAVGKSSLINALAGAEISRPGLGATTRAAVLYVHEQDDPASLFEYSHALGIGEQKGIGEQEGSGEQQETELVRHHRDELLHKVLVDTPDIDSIRLQHRAVTSRLVHAADLVLFVTSPEKYKVMRSARWVLEQRQQRALAFVLNKWDRQALGLQHDRRAEVADDFRDVLAGEGFPDALVFKVSALTTPLPERGPDDIENELPALRAWLETGITQSTAGVIRRRRLRAAWGRLAAAVEQAAPRPLSSHPLLPELLERLASRAGEAEQSVSAEALVHESGGLEDNGWPTTPGVLGMWVRAWRRIASATVALRTGLASFGVAPPVDPDSLSHYRPVSGNAFGARGGAILADTARQVISDASAARMALGPVGAAWIAETSRLGPWLATVPLEVAAELTARANRPTLRRFAGIAWVYAVEGLIMLALLVALGRAGIDFVRGTYAPGGLFGTVAMLVFMLVIIGQSVAAMFFPPLRLRMRRAMAQRARSLVKTAAERMRSALRDHVEAVDRLAREGQTLLYQIDQAMIALITENGDASSVDRLFGGPRPQQRLLAAATSLPIRTGSSNNEPARRRPSFD